MKLTNVSSNQEKKFYETPEIEVVELDKTVPLLMESLRGAANAGSVEEEDW